MKITVLFALPFLFVTNLCSQPSTSGIETQYRESAQKIIAAALKDSATYKRLAELCDRFGHRLSGSEALEKTIDWTLQEMKNDGLENVRGEQAMVPHWVRGEESCSLLLPRRMNLPMLGLGGSIATPPEGITAEVLVLGSFDELEQRKAEVKGKIVLFNVPFTKYGETVQYRVNGPSKAALAGAVAMLVRSVGPASMRSPHTGMLRYDEKAPKIPSAAITLEDAEMLSRMAHRGEKISVKLTMSAKTLPDVPSRNVVAELRGSEKPEEIVVVGGHIDSWDVGQGAMDDGGGCVVTWQAIKLLKNLGLRPKRTIRLVLWTNEENGVRGGQAYAAAHGDEKHVLALESDEGTFKPKGFGITGTPEQTEKARAIARLLEPIGANHISTSGGGADIEAIVEKQKIPSMSLEVDATKYFWYHHTEADTMDKLDAKELNECVAAVAVMLYIWADFQ